MYNLFDESHLSNYFKKEKESTWAKIQQKSPFRFFCDWTTLLCLPDYKADVYSDWCAVKNLPGYQNLVKFDWLSGIIFVTGIILIGRVFLVCPVTKQMILSREVCVATAACWDNESETISNKRLIMCYYMSLCGNFTPSSEKQRGWTLQPVSEVHVIIIWNQIFSHIVWCWLFYGLI